MATEVFLKLDRIQGPSVDRDHPGEILVLSWSWGVSAPAAAEVLRDRASSTRSIARDFQFVHGYDIASPPLFRAAASGRHIPLAVLSVCRSTGVARVDLLKVTMTDVTVTSVQAGLGDGQQDLMESVSLRSSQIAFEYHPVDPTGGLGPPVAFSWDQATNSIT